MWYCVCLEEPIQQLHTNIPRTDQKTGISTSVVQYWSVCNGQQQADSHPTVTSGAHSLSLPKQPYVTRSQDNGAIPTGTPLICSLWSFSMPRSAILLVGVHAREWTGLN